MEQITLGRGIMRSLVRHCPRCGGGRVFRRWFSMAPTCPTCGLRFERVEGYWTGSMALNMVVTEVVFVVVLVATIVLTLPDPDWTIVLIAALASNIIVPLGFFPASRLIWVTVERLMHADQPTD